MKARKVSARNRITRKQARLFAEAKLRTPFVLEQRIARSIELYQETLIAPSHRFVRGASPLYRSCVKLPLGYEAPHSLRILSNRGKRNTLSRIFLVLPFPCGWSIEVDEGRGFHPRLSLCCRASASLDGGAHVRTSHP